MPRLFVDRLSEDDYLPVLRRGLEFIGFSEMVGPSTRVFVKPNLTFPEYRPGVMTNPRCVEAALIAIGEYTRNVFVGDSDSGGYNPFPMEEVYRATGIDRFVKAHGAELVNLSRLPRRPITFELGRRTVHLDLPLLLTDEIDLLVTVPVPKIHMNTGVSLAFKNQWGCIPEPADRLRLHPDFAKVVLEVNRAVHSKVAIVDGAFGLDVSGPMKGQPVPMGWLMAADDLGAASWACCRVMGIRVDAVRHLRLAEREGWIPPQAQIIMSESLDDFVAEPFHLRRRWTDYPGLLAFNSRLISYLGYFSPLAGLLHRLLYLFREPFYDYNSGRPLGGASQDPPAES